MAAAGADTVTETAVDAVVAKVIIGAVRETAPGERRVALTPETCKKLTAAGASVRIEHGLGDGAHASDAAYADAGAEVVDSADACWRPPISWSACSRHRRRRSRR